MKEIYDTPLVDVWDPEDRAEQMELVINDSIDCSNGAFQLEDLSRAQRVLDLGMGRGAIGGYLRQLNPGVELTGIDAVTNYTGKTLKSLYSRILCGDLMEENVWDEFRLAEPFDLIIGVALPPQIVESLTQNEKLRTIVKDEKMCILISDFSYRQEKIRPFTLYQGDVSINESILIWRNPLTK